MRKADSRPSDPIPGEDSRCHHVILHLDFHPKHSGVRMASSYSKKRWHEFRDEVIELDGRACCRCQRTAADGAVLQVHHKQYVRGRMPWECAPCDCETLCKGCHAAEHGIIPPLVGWQYLGDGDLGSLIGCCDYCGQSIRYEFYIQHEAWPMLTVGTLCCDSLTGSQLASNHMESVTRYASRKNRFLSSTRWKAQGASHSIKQSGLEVKIAPTGAGFRVNINNRAGKKELSTLDEAKQLAFDVIESGAAQSYLERPRRSRQK